MQRHTLLLISSDDAGWSDLRRVLRGMSNINIVGEATTYRQACDMITEFQPDAIIAATKIEGRSIVPLLAILHQRCCPQSKIILVGHHYLSAEGRPPAETGVVGYLLWPDLAGDAIRHYLAVALAGDIFLASRDVVRPFLHARRYPTDTPPPPPLRSAAGGATRTRLRPFLRANRRSGGTEPQESGAADRRTEGGSGRADPLRPWLSGNPIGAARQGR